MNCDWSKRKNKFKTYAFAAPMIGNKQFAVQRNILGN